VITEFIIDTLGEVTNVKIIKGVNAEIDQEAERIIKRMGRWTAGSQGGQKVRVLFRLPILFKIDRYTKRKFKLKKLDQ
jgi:protein TonB